MRLVDIGVCGLRAERDWRPVGVDVAPFRATTGGKALIALGPRLHHGLSQLAMHTTLTLQRFLLAFTCAALAGRLAAATPDITSIEKIDVHAHIFEDLPPLMEFMRANNIRAINVCNNGTDGHLDTMHRLGLAVVRQHADVLWLTSTFDLLRRNEPTYAAEAIAHLGRTFDQGAVGVKVWKEIGLEIKGPDGKFILPDDPLFDPIYAYIAGRGRPLHAHLAEPLEAWLPLDPESVSYRYYKGSPEWHLHGKPEYPSHAAIIAARDNILRKHPKLVMVAAHLGSLEHDLDAIAGRFDRYPNFNIECAARVRYLTRHPPERVRELFIKYQDRILYGVDMSWKPYRNARPATEAMRQAYILRRQERYLSDFAYFAGSGEITYEGRKVQALGLPREVLEKFYNGNARRIYRLGAVK
jgi:predicted TIM-barrel fold metal-dependent hydrolase